MIPKFSRRWFDREQLDLTPGAHKVRFTAVAKNPSSHGDQIGIDYLAFKPVK
jgi:hypothetical protein